MARPPKKGTKRYADVLELGCGGEQDYSGDYDCSHQYPWTCDHCPIVVEKYRDKTKAGRKTK